jgi:hypothetical protein
MRISTLMGALDRANIQTVAELRASLERGELRAKSQIGNMSINFLRTLLGKRYFSIDLINRCITPSRPLQ